MTPKGVLMVGLLGLAVLCGTALGFGVGRPPARENPGAREIRAEIEKSRKGLTGRELFIERQCITCHGADGSGTDMGPGLGVVMPLYLEAAGGDAAAARGRVAAYLRDPRGEPKLRRDSTRYPNPMPSARGLGLKDEEIDRVVDYLLRMKPPEKAVGGDASGR